MRRSEREITNKKHITEIIKRCSVIRLGFIDKEEVYIVPLNFGFETEEDPMVFYFHGALSGRKYNLIKKSPRVGFELDTDLKISGNEKSPCSYTAHFSSIIGTGDITLCHDNSEKVKGLNSIMLHNTGKDDYTYQDAMLEKTCVFKLTVCSLSCKAH